MLTESLATAEPAFESFKIGIFGSDEDNFVDSIKDMLEMKRHYAEERYTEFRAVMQVHGYAWEAFKVPTEDGYTLTTFRVTGKVQEDGSVVTRDPTEPPVLVQHGLGSDAATWLWTYTKGVPLPLQLYDEGFDVWLGNNRGTGYSQVHESLSSDQKEFWQYDWAEMGRYDTPANISMIKEQTGFEKILYLGYSQGTTQMFYGLSKYEESFYADSLLKFTAFAPCIRFAQDSEKVWGRSIFRYDDLGIYAEGGRFQLGNIAKICTHIPRNCKQAVEWLPMQPSSVQSSLHYGQCSIEKRFQEYSPTYELGDTQTALIPLDSINKVPIAMFVGKDDHLCDAEQARDIRDTMGAAIQHYEELDGFTHLTFGGNSSPDFVQKVVNQLKTGYDRPQRHFLQ